MSEDDFGKGFHIEWFRYNWEGAYLNEESSEWVSLPWHYQSLDAAKIVATTKHQSDKVPVRIVKDFSTFEWELGEVDFDAEREYFGGWTQHA